LYAAILYFNLLAEYFDALKLKNHITQRISANLCAKEDF